MKNTIYIIGFNGRNESEYWDFYPELDLGFFTNLQKAEKLAKQLTKAGDFNFDTEADEKPCFCVVPIQKSKNIKA